MLSIVQKLSSSLLVKSWIEPTQCILSRNYAARRGTRERKSKKKVKAVVEKVGFIPHNQRNREKILAARRAQAEDNSNEEAPNDDIYRIWYYKIKPYSVHEAIKCLRETHHPDIYNQPNSPLETVVELNMQGEKKTRFVENFNRICGIKHHFPHGEYRTIIAFAKDEDEQKAALDAGAQLSGGVNLVKNIQNGQVSLLDFQFVIAHPDILHELASLRGILKKKFPSAKLGTLDMDLGETVNRFLHGINYTAVKDELEKTYGVIETTIGMLNMDAQHLEDNFSSLMKDIMSMKPKRDGEFITRVFLKTPISREKLKVDYTVYLESSDEKKVKVDEDNEEVDQMVVL